MRRHTLPLVIAGCIALAALLTWIALSSATFGKRPRHELGAAQEAPVTETVAPFTRLQVSGTAEVVLVQGDGHTVALPAGSRKSAHLSWEVHDGTLYLESEGGGHWWDLLVGNTGNRAPQIVVTFADLREIAAQGTVKLSAAGIKVNDLKVEGTGGTAVRIDDLVAQDLQVTGAGALRADISGRVVNQEITISGAGDFRGGRLLCQNATVFVAGAARVLVNAEKTLNATISGAGSVEYIGDPKVTERVSGVGRVKRRDATIAAVSVAAANPSGSL